MTTSYDLRSNKNNIRFFLKSEMTVFKHERMHYVARMRYRDEEGKTW